MTPALSNAEFNIIQNVSKVVAKKKSPSVSFFLIRNFVNFNLNEKLLIIKIKCLSLPKINSKDISTTKISNVFNTKTSFNSDENLANNGQALSNSEIIITKKNQKNNESTIAIDHNNNYCQDNHGNLFTQSLFDGVVDPCSTLSVDDLNFIAQELVIPTPTIDSLLLSEFDQSSNNNQASILNQTTTTTNSSNDTITKNTKQQQKRRTYTRKIKSPLAEVASISTTLRETMSAIQAATTSSIATSQATTENNMESHLETSSESLKAMSDSLVVLSKSVILSFIPYNFLLIF